VIAIVDYGVGNLGSILNMLRKIGAEARISSSVNDLQSASKLILPGVGAFDEGMSNLNRSGLRETLDELVLGTKLPVLGLCLGMQLLSKGSEEGKLAGLGWIEGECVRFPTSLRESGLKIPHMGWNSLEAQSSSSLFAGFSDPPRFYFVHSYHLVCADPADVVATVHHGIDVAAAVTHGNVMGVQFHPEKSHTHGMRLLKAFAEI
jgi:glutamine amidotransferase